MTSPRNIHRGLTWAMWNICMHGLLKRGWEMGLLPCLWLDHLRRTAWRRVRSASATDSQWPRSHLLMRSRWVQIQSMLASSSYIARSRAAWRWPLVSPEALFRYHGRVCISEIFWSLDLIVVFTNQYFIYKVAVSHQTFPHLAREKDSMPALYKWNIILSVWRKNPRK